MEKNGERRGEREEKREGGGEGGIEKRDGEAGGKNFGEEGDGREGWVEREGRQGTRLKLSVIAGGGWVFHIRISDALIKPGISRARFCSSSPFFSAAGGGAFH